jgi:transcriptional regulator with XRE-family HTH domain
LVDADDEARTMGRRVRQIRHSRGKSLVVVAGLAGMNKSELSRIERGESALDRRSKIVALASALQVAPSELTRIDVPAPGNGDNDAAVEAVHHSLMAVSRNRPGGQVLGIDEVHSRVRAVLDAGRQCREVEVGAALPMLIRDVYSSIAAGRDVAELLDLAVMLHVPGASSWLKVMGARVELRSLNTLMARQAAENRDDPTMLGLAVWGDGLVLLSAGDFELARAELEAVTVPTNTPESMQLAGQLALCRSLVAAADRRPADVDAAVDYASELAEHTGQDNAYWLGFGPVNVGLWRLAAAVEGGDYERAAAVAERLDPRAHPSRDRQAAYWSDYGRALARLRGRHGDAVLALRRAELLSAPRMQRNPFVREVLGELLARSRRDSPVGRELRGMAYRAGLPV